MKFIIDHGGEWLFSSYENLGETYKSNFDSFKKDCGKTLFLPSVWEEIFENLFLNTYILLNYKIAVSYNVLICSFFQYFLHLTKTMITA